MPQNATQSNAHLLISAFQHEFACDDGILLVTSMCMPAELGARPKLIYMTTVAKLLEPAKIAGRELSKTFATCSETICHLLSIDCEVSFPLCCSSHLASHNCKGHCCKEWEAIGKIQPKFYLTTFNAILEALFRLIKRFCLGPLTSCCAVDGGRRAGSVHCMRKRRDLCN